MSPVVVAVVVAAVLLATLFGACLLVISRALAALNRQVAAAARVVESARAPAEPADSALEALNGSLAIARGNLRSRLEQRYGEEVAVRVMASADPVTAAEHLSAGTDTPHVAPAESHPTTPEP